MYLKKVLNKQNKPPLQVSVKPIKIVCNVIHDSLISFITMYIYCASQARLLQMYSVSVAAQSFLVHVFSMLIGRRIAGWRHIDLFLTVLWQLRLLRIPFDLVVSSIIFLIILKNRPF